RRFRKYPGDGQADHVYASLAGQRADLLDRRELAIVPVAVLIRLGGVAERESPALGRLPATLVLSREQAAGDRVVGDDADAVLQAEGQHLALDLAKEQVVAR